MPGLASRTGRRPAAIVLLAALALGPAASGLAQEATGYLTPPAEIVDILDAPPTPQALVSPSRDTVALLARPAMPSIAEVARPMLRLAGFRLNPRTNGPTPPGSQPHHRQANRGRHGACVRRAARDHPRRRRVLAGRLAPAVHPHPLQRIEAWVMETATGRARPLSDTSINAAWGNPCDCSRRDHRPVPVQGLRPGGAPRPAQVPPGPNIQEHRGGRGPHPDLPGPPAERPRRGAVRVLLHQPDRHHRPRHRPAHGHRPARPL